MITLNYKILLTCANRNKITFNKVYSARTMSRFGFRFSEYSTNYKLIFCLVLLSIIIVLEMATIEDSQQHQIKDLASAEENIPTSR